MITKEMAELINKCRGKSVADLNPELAAEWHPTKNNELTPAMVTPGSNKHVWWFTYAPHPITGEPHFLEWRAKIASRVSGCGCPYLTGNSVSVGFNDLETLCPKMASWWHPIKNGDLKPSGVTFTSHQKVWWFYPYLDPRTNEIIFFEWEEKVSVQTKTQSCPFLSGKRVWVGYNDLSTTHPDLAREWHDELNGDLAPETVTAGSNKKVWWLKEYHDPISNKIVRLPWQATVVDRAGGADCPYLTGNDVLHGFNDLKTRFPQVANRFHPSLNGKVKPYKLAPFSNKHMHWVCEEGHTWLAQVASQSRGCYCPTCNVSKGEMRIINFLKKKGVPFIAQYRFSDCRSKAYLPFDFAVLDDNGRVIFLIEYDGEQHFRPIDFAGDGSAKELFDATKKRDRIKNEYCRNRKIPLVRIPYWKFDEVEAIIAKRLGTTIN